MALKPYKMTLSCIEFLALVYFRVVIIEWRFIINDTIKGFLFWFIKEIIIFLKAWRIVILRQLFVFVKGINFVKIITNIWSSRDDSYVLNSLIEYFDVYVILFKISMADIEGKEFSKIKSTDFLCIIWSIEWFNCPSFIIDTILLNWMNNNIHNAIEELLGD